MRRVRCPTCRREVVWEGNRFRPFCSDRCRLLDLAAWADERYRVPGEPLPEPDEANAPDGDGRTTPEDRPVGRPVGRSWR